MHNHAHLCTILHSGWANEHWWRGGDCASNITRYGKKGCRRARKKDLKSFLVCFCEIVQKLSTYYSVCDLCWVKREWCIISRVQDCQVVLLPRSFLLWRFLGPRGSGFTATLVRKLAGATSRLGLLARSWIIEIKRGSPIHDERFTCRASACNLAVAASDRLLDTPLLTPDVEWWPEALEMLEKPDWVDWRLVMEPM